VAYVPLFPPFVPFYEYEDSIFSDRCHIEWRGKPLAIRSDNGPEYISGIFIAWAARRGIRLDHIQPGNPQQNAYIERYNRTVRYDWLNQYLFESIDEVQDCATDSARVKVVIASVMQPTAEYRCQPNAL
jgi:transposase InsO family protein